MNNQQEQWRDIEGYGGRYQVSNMGRVWSVERESRGHIYGGHELLPNIDHRNRYTASLSKDGRTRRIVLARLVAKAFCPNPDPATMKYVNHKDENPANNRADNLEWCTHKYNCNYGTRMERIKEAQNMAVVQYTLDGRYVAEYASMHLAAQAIGKEAGHICDCCQGNRRWAYGYFWRYKDDTLYQDAARRISRKTADSRRSYAKAHEARARNVVQLTLDGRYVATLASTLVAAKAVGSYRSSIIDCCNGKQGQSKGFRFVYEKDYRPNEH